MKKNCLTILVLCVFQLTAYAQSFLNLDELLELSEMDPLACEKTVTSKGFSFVSTDGLNTKYNKRYEAIEYELSPRSIRYVGEDRIFFLEASSRVIKMGFTLAGTEGTLINNGIKIKAQQYEKGKFTVWLHTSVSDGTTNYYIQVDNRDASGAKQNLSSKKKFTYKGDKTPISFGYWYAGFILSKGTATEAAKPGKTMEQAYRGLSGLGLKNGFETGIGGILGLNGLNKLLPHALDFGIMLQGQFSLVSFSIEGLGPDYKAYSYDDFIQLGFGLGPAITLTPFKDLDFHISGYYKLDLAGNFGGAFDYNGGENYDNTLVRDAGSFAWIKSYGFIMHGKNVYFSTAFSNFTDQGKFTQTRKTYNPNTTVYDRVITKFQADLPFQQVTFKLGLVFH